MITRIDARTSSKEYRAARRGALAWRAWALAVSIAGLATSNVLALQETPSVSELAKQLRSGDRQAKRDAAYALSQLGTRAKPALPALIKALDDRDVQVWAYSVTAIAHIGPEASDAIPRLIKQLQRWPPQQRYRLAMALARIGKPAIEPLTEALSDANAGRRAGAALALGSIGTEAAAAAGPLATLLEDSVAAVRDRASVALARLGPSAVDPVVERLSHPKAETRIAALKSLALMKSTAHSATPAVRKQLGDSEPGIRAASIDALASIEGVTSDNAGVFEHAIFDSNETVRRAAFEALAGAPSIDPILPAMLRALKHDDRKIRREAAELLGIHRIGTPAAVRELIDLARRDAQLRPIVERCLTDLGPKASDAMLAELPGADEATETVAKALSAIGVTARDSLLQAATSPAAPTRAAAIRSLAALGDSPESRSVVEKGLRDASPVVRAAAVEASLRAPIEDDDLRRRLLDLLDDEAPEVRRAAVPVLRTLSPDTSQAVSNAVKLLRSSDLQTRSACLEAIGSWKRVPDALAEVVLQVANEPQRELRRAAMKVFPLLGIKYRQRASTWLVEQAADKSRAVRAAAIEAIAAMPGSGKEHLELLIKALQDDDGKVREQACLALAKIGRDAKPAVPALLELLDRREDESLARQALQSIGSAGPDAVPQLRKMLHDRDPRRRSYAVFLLGRVEPPPKDVLPELEN